ncbi:MAG: endonuclease/exonuclease/phosphatase family protein [Candidatus Thiodiazotropha taylori]|nr:endonuclease/exonuclease/phosphatase family protein [Candidatus Thiodiazotropha taylori]MCW4307566.1 endonuclease/exonuclease/phosphatase family protein [Candidatus Thiodiazotropha endolucinida]
MSVADCVIWLSVILLCAGDVQPNPGPQSVSTSSSSTSSTMSGDILQSLSLNHNLSFVQYNVQSIINKLDVLHAELFEVDILAFTETWLNPSIPDDELLLQSYNKPERKDRTDDPHGGVMIYVKDAIHYKRRYDLEIGFTENIWIELTINRRKILFGLFFTTTKF